MAPTLPRAAALAAAALAVLATIAPLAAAHTTVHSGDGKVRVVIGQLNEPVSTYAVSGLDVCFQANATARTPIAGVNAGGLTAVLRAPDGDELQQDLRAQFGRPGCFSFAEPYVLTQPGQYVVDLSGDVNGSAVDVRDVKAGGAVIDRSNITFPDPAVASNLELQAEVDALEARLAALESRASTGVSKGAPAPAAALLVVGLAALAAVRRLR